MTGPSQVQTELVALDVPEGWTIEKFEGADAVLVAPVAEGDFRANIVLTSVGSAAPVDDALRAAIEAAWMQHPGAQVIGADVWRGQVEGRRLVFTYPVGDADQVDVQKWVWATGNHHVHLSASSTPMQREAIDRVAVRLASSIRILGKVSEASAEAGGDGLEFVHERQRMRVDGPVIPRTALELLATASGTGRVERRALRTADGAALIKAGFVGHFGGLTARGQDVCAHWARPTSAVLRIDRAGFDDDGVLSAWFGAASVLLAGPRPAGSEPLADGDVVLWTTSASRMAAAVSAWMGVAPSRAFADEYDLTFAAGTIQRRLLDPATPPPQNAGQFLADAWSRPWTAYDIRTRRGLLPLVMLDDGRWWRRRNVGGGEQLAPMPAAAVYEALHSLVWDALLAY